MGKDDPKLLYIAAYDDPDGAQGDFDALKDLVKHGVIFTDVAVLVRRDDEGKIEVKENAHEVAGGSMVGAAAGLIIGLIFPPGVIAATVVGGGLGAGAGGLLSHHREHEIKKDIEDVLPPGSSGIVTVFDVTWKPKVDDALKKASKVDEEEVDAESVEKVKEAAKG
ncbi:MAG TPA: DUF1269 domain-containing protein [Actinomycetota bacterium]|nr:DUF1269 domain-containing protein [Actinomycetota bacterium]